MEYNVYIIINYIFQFFYNTFRKYYLQVILRGKQGVLNKMSLRLC